MAVQMLLLMPAVTRLWHLLLMEIIQEVQTADLDIKVKLPQL